MPKIQRLSPHVADLIAAGEVVERPGSAVKELMENSIDAGAKLLTVEIKNGGMTYIRVTDNGCGMSAEDAETAFLRHATSKLRDERGLEAIGTLGFRGEALAAISAVSRVTLKTRENGAAEGTEVRLEGGEVTFSGPCGCPEGTTIVVADLFFNTPARLKFMKNDRAEGMNVSAAVLRCALSHPELSVRYIKDGKEECHTAGDGRTDSCVYTLLGREMASSMLRAETTHDGVAVTGYVSPPSGARGSRASQFFFVNGRFVRSKLLQAALEQAYKNSLFTGRFPACVLYMTLPPSEVDVNVHPTKTEVKFLREKAAFDGVYYAALAALDGETEKAEIKLSPSTRAVIDDGAALKARAGVPSGGFETMPAEKFKSTFKTGGFKTAIPPASSRGERPQVKNETFTPYQTRFDMPRAAAPEREPEKGGAPPFPPADWRMVGEALTTYIIVERGDSVFLIDKHAAHERMRFDALKAQNSRPMTQALLAPVIFPLAPEDMEALGENLDFLRSLGFEADIFDGGRAAVREAPEDIDAADIPAAVGELCGLFRQGRFEDAETRRDAALRTVACRSAIKAGRASEPEELRVLCERVMSGEVKYCPHGRPVAMELTRTQLDRGFKRI